MKLRIKILWFFLIPIYFILFLPVCFLHAILSFFNRQYFTDLLKVYFIFLTKNLYKFLNSSPYKIKMSESFSNLIKEENLHDILIIANHRSNFDWFFIELFLYDLNANIIKNLRIILKKELRDIFFFGYYMEIFDYIFIHKNYAKDAIIFENYLKDENNNLLIFPEGTVYDENSFQKSKEIYSQKNIQIENWEVLPIRRGGIKILKKKKWRGIIDITLLMKPYERFPNKHFTLENFLSGNLRFDFLVDYIPFESLEHKDVESLEEYIFSLFERKTEKIRSMIYA